MASANDMKAANSTYASFISAIKWTTPVIVAITAFVIMLLVG